MLQPNQEEYNDPNFLGGYVVSSDGTWKQVTPITQTPLNIAPRAAGSGIFKSTNPTAPTDDPVIRSYGPRGEQPRYYETKSGLIVQPQEQITKEKQYKIINDLKVDCATRTAAIDARLLEIGVNAQKVLSDLEGLLSADDFQTATALIPLVVKLVNPKLGAIVGYVANLNYKATKDFEAAKVQKFKITLATYEGEARQLLDLKKGCEGNLTDDDLLPRSANLSTTNIILIVAAIILLLYLYKRKQSKK